MAKHLGISERTMIERGLALGNSFKVIGDMIERSPSTISREVKRHRIFVSRNHNQRNDCVFFSSVSVGSLQPNEGADKSLDFASSLTSETLLELVGFHINF